VISQDLSENFGFFVLVCLLIFAPLIRGGNRPLALLILELVALVLAAYALWRPRFQQQLSTLLLGMLLLLFVLPLVQLVPLPFTWWASLPGRQDYAQALSQIDHDKILTDLHPASLIPYETEAAWLALLPPLMVFLVAVGLATRQLQVLIKVFLGVAAAQAILGLIQYGDGAGSVFYLGNEYMAGSAAGTYINRNHLAGLLEMALPLVLALLTATVGHSRQHRSHRRRRKKNLRQRFAHLGELRINQAALYGAVSLAVLLGLVFTRSRAGISLAMLGILLCTLVFSNRLGGKNVYGLVGTLTVIGLSLAVMIGLVPVLVRFAYQDSLADGRWSIFAGVLQGMGEFFPLGSGVGTFMDVFHRYHPQDVPGVLINRAHNDYIEWILENGLVAAVMLVLFTVLYLYQWSRVWCRGTWSIFRFAQVGAGIALLLMALHTFVDFNLHIPANAIFFAFLAAVFFHYSQEEHRHERKPQSTTVDSIAESKHIPELPPENQINPFAE
jgi:O-antigen ligase